MDTPRPDEQRALRYAAREDRTGRRSARPGRPEATCAALIPISKNEEWWGLTQDERRQIFEETSGHIRIGMDYLPAVARRLHHCRDLGSPEPFDFLDAGSSSRLGCGGLRRSAGAAAAHARVALREPRDGDPARAGMMLVLHAAQAPRRKRNLRARPRSSGRRCGIQLQAVAAEIAGGAQLDSAGKMPSSSRRSRKPPSRPR